MYKWQVRRTKSQKRWAVWRARQKRHTARVFENWAEAVCYAFAMAEIDRRFRGAP